jgi:hypothetical protein
MLALEVELSFWGRRKPPPFAAEWAVSVFNRLPTEGYTQGGKF